MVGRGLRGPKNGGTDEVLIVNMLDNILEFGDSIVFQSVRDMIDPEFDAPTRRRSDENYVVRRAPS